ncbi:porin [Ruegeria pomeroyi]|nr:porin [Ruegeria pomeroyi]
MPLVTALAVAATPALAELKYNNSSGGSVTLYGQLNPSFQYFDDGVRSYRNLTDSSHSNSRVGIKVDQPFSWGTLGFNFETGIGAPASNGFSQTNSPDWDWDRTKIRKVDFEFRTESAGTFYIGQGSMASDGVATQDLSRTSLVLGNDVGDSAGGFQFRTSAGALSGTSIRSVMPNLDGGRRGRIRYDTPSFSGFSLAVAAGEDILSTSNSDEYYDVAVRYSNEFNGTRVRGAIGHNQRERSGSSNVKDTFGSLSVLFPSGFNVHFSMGNRNGGGDYAYGKLGYIGKWWSVGDTAIAVDYYNGSDFGTSGSDSGSYGIGVVQHFDDANVQAYASLRRYDYSEPGTSYLKASSFSMGARWQF